MEEAKKLLQDANRYLNTADHLCYITYPLVNDTKLLIIIAENIFNALNKGISALLYYERLYKRINLYPEDFNSKFDVFKFNCAQRYNFPRENIALIQDVKELVINRREAPMEFARKDKFIIASDNFKLHAISLDTVKKYISQTKLFMDRLNEVFAIHDRRFGRER